MLLFSSCSKDYLETTPTDAVSDLSVFKSTNNAWGAINGIHRMMFFQHGNMDQAGQGGIMIHMDMLGEDVVNTAQGNGWFNSTYQWTLHRNINASSVAFIYRFYYRVISNANMIIANIDNAEGPAADQRAIKGQAYAYRAWAHFNLVQLYAKRYDAAAKPNMQLGVPLMLINTTEGQPRATVEEVYAQINLDLDEAIKLLDGYTRKAIGANPTAKSHLNINVARGLKARVALTQGEWQTAADLAVQARQGFALMSNTQYLDGFNKVSNPEWIWGSYQADDQQTYFHSFFAFMSSNFNSTNIRTNPKAINSALYETMSATDVRRKVWDPTGTTSLIPPGGIKRPYMTIKFQAQSSAASIGDVVYMRSAEMHLIEAEAKARLGQDAAAQDALFTLMKNRDPQLVRETLSTLTGQELINTILRNRRIELWGEGFRFFDLKRTNSALNRRGANHNEALVTANAMEKPAGSKEWEWLIPIAEMNANKEMIQNEL